jgi:transposase
LLPALTLEGIIYAKIVEGSFTAERFIEFLEGLLANMNPFPAKNSVLIMDNARVHRNSQVREMIEARYVVHLYRHFFC